MVQPMSPTGRPRPALLRALGRDEPPAEITVDGRTYHRAEVLKHDSWAATAIYVDGSDRVVCKFNRRQPIFGLRMGWLGRRLARRESAFYAALADLPCVPPGCGPVYHNGRLLKNAAAHRYVEGRPLKPHDRFSVKFFDQLDELLAEVHRRGIVYMDLHKRENVLLGADGRPYLIDFQVSLGFTQDSWFAPARWLMRLLQAGDRYHLQKHRQRHSLAGAAATEPARPWWIRLHRIVAQPLRQARRRLLVLLGVRRGKGRAPSEHFTEDGLRPESPDTANTRAA